MSTSQITATVDRVIAPIQFNAAALGCGDPSEPLFLPEEANETSCIEVVNQWLAQQPVDVQEHLEDVITAINQIGEHYWQPTFVDLACVRELAKQGVSLRFPEKFDDYKALLEVSEQAFLISLKQDFSSSCHLWAQLIPTAFSLARSRAERMELDAAIAADDPVRAVKAWLRRKAPSIAMAGDAGLIGVAAWLAEAQEHLPVATYDWLLRQPVKFVSDLQGDRDPLDPYDGCFAGAYFALDYIQDMAGNSEHSRIIETLTWLARLDVTVPDIDYFKAANKMLRETSVPLFHQSVQHCKTADSLTAFQRLAAGLMKRDAGLAAMLGQCERPWNDLVNAMIGTAAHLIAPAEYPPFQSVSADVGDI